MERAIVVFDHDASADLNFVEFVTMFVTSNEFKFKLTPPEREQILLCIERQASSLVHGL